MQIVLEKGDHVFHVVADREDFPFEMDFRIGGKGTSLEIIGPGEYVKYAPDDGVKVVVICRVERLYIPATL